MSESKASIGRGFLVLAEAMHGSGAAHMFEFTSIYTMSSGHIAVEILTTPPAQFVALNEPRYRTMKLNGAQTNEILAQAGSLVREGMLIGAISWVLGVIVAYPLSQLLSVAVGNAFVNTPLDYTFAFDGALVWLAFVLVLSALASYLPARRAARLTVREVLAYE